VNSNRRKSASFQSRFSRYEKRNAASALPQAITTGPLPILFRDQSLDEVLRLAGDWPLLPVVRRANLTTQRVSSHSQIFFTHFAIHPKPWRFLPLSKGIRPKPFVFRNPGLVRAYQFTPSELALMLY
jgi:hypothetical protein